MTLSPSSTGCCEEFSRAAAVSRRRFLGGVAAVGATAVTTSLFGDAVRSASYAATTGGNVLVVLSFRGGIDGLGMVVPYADPGYAQNRRTIAVPSGSLWAKDATFGLHPKLMPLKWLWDAGELAAVQAVGLPAPNRSHFEAMEAIEDADPGSSLRQGWVNRMVGLGAAPTARSAIHLGDSAPPTLIEGPAPSLATHQLGDVKLTGTTGGWTARRRAHLGTVWDNASGPMADAARSALESERVLGPIGSRPPRSAVAYPDEAGFTRDLAGSLQSSAALIKADVGAEVISVDFGSWDMHDNYGTLDYGEFQRMTDAFARCLSAFMQDLGAARSRVTVVTISEFGRRVAENGNRGLDHGWGNMMLLAGAGVRGGRYHGSWPGLATRNLEDGDLKVTTDYRQILGEVVHKRFPDKDVTRVFPISYAPIGVLS